MADPAQPSSAATPDWIKKGQPTVIAVGRDFDVWDDPHLETIAFDLSLPIADQIGFAEAYLKKLQASRVKENRIKLLPKKLCRTGSWEHYLRVLDAEADDVGTAEIASVLLPKMKNVDPENAASDAIRKDLKAAKQLRDEHFQGVTMMREKK